MIKTATSTLLLSAAGISIGVDLTVGHLAHFEIERDGRRLAPFHRAPWADDTTPPDGVADTPHLARLSGDFFCAPFAASDIENAPAHGWTANAEWRLISSESIACGIRATFELQRKVMGARVLKELSLVNGHPFLYQRHIFENGTGRLPVANHAMIRLPSGGRIKFSPKRWAETADTPLENDPERGRSLLAYPARATDMTRFPRSDGGVADLTSYPIGLEHEDLAMLIEMPGNSLGWTAVTRHSENDVVLTLKNPSRLPVTMLWHSNGGRAYAPWNSRHRNVLGIEDGCTLASCGHAASIEPNWLSEIGIPTAICLDPEDRIDVRHVIGALPIPSEWNGVKTINVHGDVLVVTGMANEQITASYDAGFLHGED